MTVPQPYFALSNGTLLSTTRDEAAGTITYHWLQDQPHSTYLMTLVVGEFSERTEMVDGLPVQWYVTPGREDDGQRAFGDTPEMVRFFSQKLGVPYPWNKYAQIAVSDFVFGGMENTTATTQTDLTLHDARAHLDFPAMAWWPTSWRTSGSAISSPASTGRTPGSTRASRRTLMRCFMSITKALTSFATTCTRMQSLLSRGWGGVPASYCHQHVQGADRSL